MSSSRRSLNFAGALKSLGLAIAGLAVLILALLFPRVFGARESQNGLGLRGPDVSHADIPYAQGDYGCDSGGGCACACEASGSTGCGSCGTGGGGG